MEVEILMFLPLCQKDKKGTVSEPSGYAVIREKAKPYGLQSPYRHPTIEDLCEHITAQLHQGESFDWKRYVPHYRGEKCTPCR